MPSCWMQSTVHILQEETLIYTGSSSPRHRTDPGEDGLQIRRVPVTMLNSHGQATVGQPTGLRLDTGITIHHHETLCYEMLCRILNVDG